MLSAIADESGHECTGSGCTKCAANTQSGTAGKTSDKAEDKKKK